MGLSHQFLAGLQFDHSNAERCANHCGKPGTIRVEHAAVTSDRWLVMLGHPFLAHLNRLLRRLGEFHIGLWLEARRNRGVPNRSGAWIRVDHRPHGWRTLLERVRVLKSVDLGTEVISVDKRVAAGGSLALRFLRRKPLGLDRRRRSLREETDRDVESSENNFGYLHSINPFAVKEPFPNWRSLRKCPAD